MRQLRFIMCAVSVMAIGLTLFLPAGFAADDSNPPDIPIPRNPEIPEFDPNRMPPPDDNFSPPPTTPKQGGESYDDWPERPFDPLIPPDGIAPNRDPLTPDPPDGEAPLHDPTDDEDDEFNY